MMNFKATFCDPSKADIIQLGDLNPEQVIENFEEVNWNEYLQKMNNEKDGNIYYSPSFEVHNKDTKHGIAISVVGDPDNYEFYIFYKRPKVVKFLFGLKEKLNENYITDTTDQTKEDAINCLQALLRNDTLYLENKIGR